MTRGPKKDALFEPVPRTFRKYFPFLAVLLGVLVVATLVVAWGLSQTSETSPVPSKTKPYPCTVTVLYHGTGQTHTCTLIRAFTDYEDGQCWVGGRSGIFTIYTTANGFKASSNWTMTSCIPLTEAKATQ